MNRTFGVIRSARYYAGGTSQRHVPALGRALERRTVESDYCPSNVSLIALLEVG